MPLTPGTRLGTFEIVAPLGAGGMGEVYRARDSRLDREVAIKVLPERVAQDAERLTRFEREAKALAALNHPNIAQIYAVEGRALIMELVEGANLAGPLPPETAVRYAAQIADALEAAHEKGIVHRDLKPANVMVTPAGTIKVLDFGLAAMPSVSRAAAADATNSPTMTIAASQAGTIMGTAGYMSPEQAAGKPVDRRADIWSFGVVLWEMLTGQALFGGETISHTLADVLRKDIDLSVLPKNTPPAVRTLLGRCLDRDVRTRLRDIGEARVLLSAPMQPAAESLPVVKVQPRWQGRWLWLAIGVCAAAIPAAWFLKPAPEEPLLKFDILPPPGAALGAANWGTMQVSPDGSNIAFVARDRNRVLKLFVRNFHSGASVAMPGTENALAPAWSPDSRQIAFLAAGKLKRLELSGSQVVEVCEASIGSFCMWHGDGDIYVSCADHVLRRVRASGGTLSTVFPETSQVLGASPAAIPGNEAFLYQLLPSPSRIVLAFPGGSIGKILLPAGSGTPASFARDHSGGGWLLHRKDTGELAAIAFDARSGSVRGDESILVRNVSGGPSWSTSNNGVLAYRSGGWGGDRQLTWLDRSGTPNGIIGEPSNVFTQRISPDQKSVVFTRIDGANSLLYVHDLARGTTTRVSAESNRNAYAEWMPDSKSVIYSVQREALGRHAIFAASGEKILQKTGALKPTGVSPDGKWLLSASITVGVPRLVLTSLETGKNTPFGGDMAKSHHGSFSPDGRWILYSAFSGGRWDVFVRPVPPEISGKPVESSGQVQISRAGGIQPAWRGDGKEIFYVADGMMMSVPVEMSTEGIRAGTPMPLFQTNLGIDDNFQREYDVTADGKRFLLPMEAPSGQTEVPITVVFNWPKLIEPR